MQSNGGPTTVREGTRERRRREMRHRIARHAVDLALARGSSAVTVEEICEQSAISVRSFYNYFVSKDAAIIGDGPVLPTPEVLGRLRSATGAAILDDLLDAVSESFAALDDDDPLSRDRAKLMRAEPGLLASMGEQMAAARDELAAIVSERLRRLRTDARSSEMHDLDVDVIIELKSAIMRAALRSWGRSHARTFIEARRQAQDAAVRSFLSS